MPKKLVFVLTLIQHLKIKLPQKCTELVRLLNCDEPFYHFDSILKAAPAKAIFTCPEQYQKRVHLFHVPLGSSSSSSKTIQEIILSCENNLKLCIRQSIQLKCSYVEKKNKTKKTKHLWSKCLR